MARGRKQKRVCPASTTITLEIEQMQQLRDYCAAQSAAKGCQISLSDAVAEVIPALHGHGYMTLTESDFVKLGLVADACDCDYKAALELALDEAVERYCA